MFPHFKGQTKSGGLIAARWTVKKRIYLEFSANNTCFEITLAALMYTESVRT